MTPKNIRERIEQKLSGLFDDYGHRCEVVDAMEALFLELLAESKVGDES